MDRGTAKEGSDRSLVEKTRVQSVVVPGLKPITIGDGAPLAFVLGPCVIESREHCLHMAEIIARLRDKLGIPVIFKSSYDKANRTSKGSFRGLGLEQGVEILAEVRAEFGLPVITDVHGDDEVRAVAPHVELLQIPAFLCRQTSLLEAAGRAKRPVLVKKGQFLHPTDMKFAAEKIVSSGGEGVLLCERGSCFGYRDLVVDMRGLQMMRGCGFPVVFDGTHSVQSMGGAGGTSGGNRSFVPLLSRAAVAAGVDGVFLETHDNPDQAPSDGPNMIPVPLLASVVRDLVAIAEVRLEQGYR